MKIKLKKIEITRAEGPIHSCGIKHEFNDYSSARAWLWSNSSSYPKQGYDKHDLRVEWENGFVFDARLDCKHNQCEHPNLDVSEYLRDHFQIYGGILKPSWMDDRKWEAFKNDNGSYVDECKRILDNYEI